MLGCIGALGKDNRIFRDAHSDFIGMAAIVLTDAPNHHQDNKSEDPLDLCKLLHHLESIIQIAFDTHVRIALLLGSVINLSRRIFVAEDSHVPLKALNLSKNATF